MLFILNLINGFQSKNHKFNIHNSNRLYDDITFSESISSNSNFEEEIENLKNSFESLSKAEQTDLLQSVANKYPGIEIDMNLYRSLYPFKLDKFQEDGLNNLMEGKNVLVTTPTGSGKTIVGELAIYFALMMGLRVAYTTPLKALSNQKFADFKERFGADRVGLLTGDIAINRGAAVTIMTTEVFRNMIYDGDSKNQLNNLFCVIFDEFHYMNDPDRGTVWEESVISCPEHVRILALSATMGNSDEIQGWMESIHGPTALVASTHRPVPLRYMFALKKGMFSLFRDPNAGPGSLNGVTKIKNKPDAGSVLNPFIEKEEEKAFKKRQSRSNSKNNGRPFKQQNQLASIVARYDNMANDLHASDLLPAIVFIFSRAGCEQSAKLVMGSKVKLLRDEELSRVNQALNTFAKDNPEIPISRSLANMLQAGVAVHHAGLIPVWKEFIEDLFNANLIKVLFATETLAAGVNMPARTTVVSSVTKRINSEVIRLKTSQLLQMAGRAGRRGMDTTGTVVIMRNRFEDSKLSHKILTNEIDGIRSHFKTSYSLLVKLLETKTVEECRALIERGFGAYQMHNRIAKKEEKRLAADDNIEEYRTILQKYTLGVAREYLKISRRLEKEERSEQFLIQQMKDTEMELVNAITDYMPLGTALYLRSGEAGFFLGDIKFGKGNLHSGYGMLTSDQELLVVRKEHIHSFAESDLALSPKTALVLLKLVDLVNEWDEVVMQDLLEQKSHQLQEETIGVIKEEEMSDDDNISHSIKKRKKAKKDDNEVNIMLKGVADPVRLASSTELLQAIDQAKAFDIPTLIRDVPGSIIRQNQIVENLRNELHASPIAQEGEGRQVLEALRFAAAQRDPIKFVNGDKNSFENEKREVFAWTMFQNVLSVLQGAGAMDGTEATDLGRLVGTLSTDNELWLATVLNLNSMNDLKPSQFAAVICGVINDGYKAANAYMKYGPSQEVTETFNDLELMSFELKELQTMNKVDYPVYISRELGGLVETWAGGVSWRELCRDTSLDQGDLCRTLRRTLEVLKQIPLADGVSDEVAELARAAVDGMDRFPVADAAPDKDQDQSPSGVGFAQFGTSSDSASASTSTNGELGSVVSIDSDSVDDIDLSFLDDTGDEDNDVEFSLPLNDVGLPLDAIDILDEILQKKAREE